jgi:hypothetical protein
MLHGWMGDTAEPAGIVVSLAREIHPVRRGAVMHPSVSCLGADGCAFDSIWVAMAWHQELLMSFGDETFPGRSDRSPSVRPIAPRRSR